MSDRLRDDPLRDVADDRVATITLEPARGRSTPSTARCARRCATRGDAVKDDPAVHAVVLRAAGDRAFCAGLDTKKPYGQPDDVWNHEDPGELLSPKWQKVWKPVVCAVQGICTAGAFYFVNESDIVICSTTPRSSTRTSPTGMVSALEPVGLMRRIGLGETLRMALSGNDERVTRRDGAAHRPRHRGRRARRRCGRGRTRSRPASRASRRAATQGTVRAIWESLDRPYRAAMEQGLIYTRLGNPIGMAEVAANPPTAARAEDAVMEPPGPSSGRSHRRRSSSIDPAAPTPSSSSGRWHSWGELGDDGRRRRRPRRRPRRRRSACSCATDPPRSASCSGVLRAGGCVVAINPERGVDRTRADLAALDLAVVAGDRRRPRRRSSAPSARRPRSRATTSARRPGASTSRGAPTPRSPPAVPGVAVQMLTSGTTGPPKRIDLTYETLERVLVGAKHYERDRTTTSPAALRAWRS